MAVLPERLGCVGAIRGVLTGHAMDIVKTLAPGLMKKWVKKTADKFIDKEE